MYQYKDHLGKICLTYGDANSDGNVTTAEIIEESNYYLFGLEHKGYNTTTFSANLRQKSKYNGKELQDELERGIYDYGAGKYPAIGKWFNIFCIFVPELYRSLCQNITQQIWLVVSTSAYAGVHIPVDLIIGELGHEHGFRLKGIHCLRYLRTSSQQYGQLKTNKAPLRESLIILEKYK